MSSLEKSISIIALALLIILPPLLFIFPKLHTLPYLVPLSLILVGMNAALLFVVFKDMFLRPFGSDKTRYLWVALVFFCPPTILIYLPLYGFKPRRQDL